MDGWKYWTERKVYLVLKNKRQYTGVVLEVDDSKPPLVWIILLDKFGKRVTVEISEIDIIQEESK